MRKFFLQRFEKMGYMNKKTSLELRR